MKNWKNNRPWNWKNSYNTEREEDGMYSRAEMFEAGADAMLEKIKGDVTEIMSPMWDDFRKGRMFIDWYEKVFGESGDKVMKEECLRCGVDGKVLREMLADIPGSDNWEYAQKIIKNCPSCEHALHKMLAVNLMRRVNNGS